ncbi:hypothetical protein PHET_09060, partial [Paragonimus heterotremus]
SPTSLPVSIGRNAKGRLALRLVFALTSNHADILRYGWHSLLDCLLQLFRANLLPEELTESEDFLAPSRRVRLTARGCIPIAEKKTKKRSRVTNQGIGQGNREVGVLSSFYQYLTSGTGWIESGDEDDVDDSSNFQFPESVAEALEPGIVAATLKSNSLDPKGRTQVQLSAGHWTNALQSAQLDEQSASRVAFETVQQCEIAQLIRDSKFLVDASLTELIKALLRAVRGDPSSEAFISHSSAIFDIGSYAKEEPTLIHALSVDPVPDSPRSAISGNLSQSSLSLDNSAVEPLESTLPSQHQSHDPSNLSKRSMTLPTTAPSATTMSYYPAFCSTGGTPTEDCRIFCLELLVRVLLHNRDRVSSLWPLVQCYLADLLLTAVEPTPLIERVIVGFLRLATHLLRRHEMTSQIFACLHYILLTRGDRLLLDCCQPSPDPPDRLQNARTAYGRSKIHTPQKKNTVGLQIISGLMHLLHNHAADLPDPVTDWQLIFSLLEVCGAGLRAQPSTPSRTRHFHHSSMYDITVNRDHDSCQYAVHSHNARGCTSDSEAPDLTYNNQHPMCDQTADSGVQSERGESAHRHPGCGWIMVDGSLATHERPSESDSSCIATQASKTQNDYPIRNFALVPVEVSSDTFLTSSSSHETSMTNLLVPSRILGIQVSIGTRDPVTLKQAADCLDFLIRDPTYITPDNFEFCVRALRVFVEACLRCQSTWVLEQKSDQSATSHQNIRNQKRSGRYSGTRKPVAVSSRSNGSESESDPETEEERRVQRSNWAKEVFLSPTTSVVAVQLLDLIHILLTRATSIYTEWTQAGSNTCIPIDNDDSSVPDSQLKSSEPEIGEHLWLTCWRPLLQATARLCCDCRREVRTDALAYLQRALLSPILQSLSGLQWEECFGMVLFPLLSGFLESIALEEVMCGNNQRGSSPTPSSHFHAAEFVDPRMRAIPLLTKVFLQHLRPLHRSKNFHSIWIRMLTYMEHYMQASSSDSLTDAVRESLKNVLLVMYTGTYDTPPVLLRDASPDSPEAVLWELTTQRLSTFLPSLLDQLFPPSMPATEVTTQTTILHPQSSNTESS